VKFCKIFNDRNSKIFKIFIKFAIARFRKYKRIAYLGYATNLKSDGFMRQSKVSQQLKSFEILKI